MVGAWDRGLYRGGNRMRTAINIAFVISLGVLFSLFLVGVVFVYQRHGVLGLFALLGMFCAGNIVVGSALYYLEEWGILRKQ